MTAFPRVSVILTYFNYKDYLPEAIKSVQGQTYSNIELVVVDDCAPDASPSEVRKLIEDDPKSKVVFHQHNQGLPVARNTGVANSDGELLVIMDSDDLLEPTFVEETVKKLEADQLDCVYTLVQTFGDRDYLWSPECTLFNLLVGNPGPATFLMKRAVFEKIGGYKPHLPLNSDHDFWINAVAAGFKVSRLNKPLYKYRKHTRSLSAIHIDARCSAVPTLYGEHKELYDSNVKELLALRETQYRNLEKEYDKIWQVWHGADLELKSVYSWYDEAQNRIRFANRVLGHPVFRSALWIYRKVRKMLGASQAAVSSTSGDFSKSGS